MVLKFVILHFKYSNICQIVNKNYQFLRIENAILHFAYFGMEKRMRFL